MRSNLLSLQGTVDLLDRTQGRLASGKKVNTAIDGPVSFFASQALNARATLIDGLKDGMGQAIQTITAADKGIKALTTMIEQAKGITQSAQTASGATVSLTPTAVSAGTASYVTVTVTTGGLANGNTIGIGSTVLTATTASTAGTNEFIVSSSATTSATNLAAAIDALDLYAATVSGSVVTITKLDTAGDPAAVTTASGDIVTSATSMTEVEVAGTAGDTMTFGSKTFTATYSEALAEADTTGLLWYAGGTDAQDAAALAAKITDNTTLTAAGWSAKEADGVITLSRSKYDLAVADFTVPGSIAAALSSTDTSELSSLMAQYNTLRSQMDELADDAGYKGKNLLDNDTMAVKFEGVDLNVAGFDASSTALGINAATWTTGGDPETSLDALDDALLTLRKEASKLSGNLSIITVRNNFSTDMINTLVEGSDKLTLADTNEEGANMLMLQTRQTLSTTALSLSAQAAQSVLRLFQ